MDDNKRPYLGMPKYGLSWWNNWTTYFVKNTNLGNLGIFVINQIVMNEIHDTSSVNSIVLNNPEWKTLKDKIKSKIA